VSTPGVVAAAVAAAQAWLIEPAEAAPEPVAPAPSAPRPVIAVFGLARGCGATVIARALAAELAVRDSSGAAAVSSEARAAAIPLATQPAARLARALEDLPGAATRAVGRLCLVEGVDQLALADCSRHHAPLVLDAGSSSLGGVPAAIADAAVLVTTPALEPALARVAAACLGRVGPEPVLVVNRSGRGAFAANGAGAEQPDLRGAEPARTRDADEAGASSGQLDARVVTLPDSRLGAQLALGGREARGELGQAIAKLADACQGR
jgi:hypothetical protein